MLVSELVECGFYHYDMRDVRCAFCKICFSVCDNMVSEDILNYHESYSSHCPLYTGEASNTSKEEASRLEHLLNLEIELFSELKFPRHREYATQAIRLATFKEWPISIPVQPDDLATAGFFYLNHSDQTHCFFCGLSISHWETYDVPWEEHAYHASKCEFVRLIKGDDFIQRVMSKKCVIRPTATAAESLTPTESPKYECAICLSAQQEVVFVPCGHAFCGDCCIALQNCAVCRMPVVYRQRLFLTK